MKKDFTSYYWPKHCFGQMAKLILWSIWSCGDPGSPQFMGILESAFVTLVSSLRLTEKSFMMKCLDKGYSRYLYSNLNNASKYFQNAHKQYCMLPMWIMLWIFTLFILTFTQFWWGFELHKHQNVIMQLHQHFEISQKCI